MMPSVLAAGDVASVDGTTYQSLQEAINNANGKTVTLLTNVTESVTISAGTNVTLDLGTNTLTNTANNHTITNNGTLTIIGSGTVDNVSHGKGALVNKGTATLDGATLTRSMEKGVYGSNGGNSWYVLDNNQGTFYMKSGKILSTSGFSSGVRNLEATFYMQGGEITNNFIALKNDDNGIIYMSGGVVNTKAAGGSAIQNWGTLEITGGTLNAVQGANALWNLTWSNDYTETSAVISGNTVINGRVELSYNNGQIDNTPHLTLNGGTINGDIVNKTPSELVITSGTVTGSITSEGDITISPADYSKVNALIEKAKTIDKTLYTEESLKALDDAIKAVDFNKNILEQSEVDEMATNIEKALNGLVKRAEPAIENPETADNVLFYVVLATIGLGTAAITSRKLLLN